MSPTPSRRIVVGVDESPTAAAALRWAVLEAARLGDVVEAVHVRRGPLASALLGAEHALEELELSIAHALSGQSGEVPIRRVLDGPVGPALVTAAATADLLVIGGSRRGPVGEALAGSVGHHCVRHASCPVVVVPLTKQTAGEHVFATGRAARI